MSEHAKTSRLPIIVAIAGLLLVGAGCAKGYGANVDVNAPTKPVITQNDNAKPKEARELKVTLGQQNLSGISGSALLVEDGTKTRVFINVTGAGVSSGHPSHIHLGSCPTPGAVEYPLSDVVAGKSETTLNASFDAILGKLPLSINLHKSAADLGTYVACGDLSAAAIAPLVPGDESMMRTEPSTKTGDESAARASFDLKAIGTSGMNGTADIKEVNGKAMVTLTVKGGSAGPHPAHIHLGSCPTPGAVSFTLSDVIGGKSVTSIDVPVANIMAAGALAINIHESKDKIGTYLSCGNLPAWDVAKAMFRNEKR
ncbi:MAG: hypothetical protein RLZZ324_555 [Candidatus Parcubacteria bacterium]|jgi:Cu/Zn superoxide dismutase